jgi:hypothetical protein
MQSLTTTLLAPFLSKGDRRTKTIKSSLLDYPPPPNYTSSERKFGPYSWKVVVEALDEKGDMYRTFVGYSKNMNITDRTVYVCDRYKKPGTTCGEAIVAMKSGDCDETIFMKEKDSDQIVRLLL